MAVLVTGGAGYIGSHMVWELLDAGEEVVVLDRLSTGFDWAVPPEARLVVGDIAETALIGSIIRRHQIDAIIHFAGSVVVPESIADPLGYYDNNTCKTRALLEAAVAGKVAHFIFSSTAAVYGSAGMQAVREDHPLMPQSPYGVSKLMSEWMLRDASAAHGFHYTALRYFNVAGADPRGRTGQSTPGATHLLKVACETALGKRPFMEIYGTDYPTPDGSCIRDYVHVSDLADAHVRALEWLIENPDENLILNCGYGRGLSVIEVLDALDRVLEREVPRAIEGRRPGDPPQLVASNRALVETLDWTPRYADIDTIVAHALAWERSLKGDSGS